MDLKEIAQFLDDNAPAFVGGKIKCNHRKIK